MKQQRNQDEIHRQYQPNIPTQPSDADIWEAITDTIEAFIPDKQKFQELHGLDEITWYFPYNGDHQRRNQ